MKLSIILPCHNIDDEYLQVGMKSLLAQTFTDFEIIVVDDCSPNPNNVKYIKSLMANDSRIKLIQNNPNQGAAESRNIGLAAAQGEYVAFFDGDDYIESDYYEKLINAAETNDADLIMCGFKRVDNSGKILKTRDKKPSAAEKSMDSLRAEQFKNLSYALWNKLYKRTLIADIKFPKGVRLAEDVEFNFQAFLKSAKSVCISGNFYYYRHNPNSVTNSERDGKTAISTNITVTAKLLKIYTGFQLGAKLKKAVEKYLMHRFVRYANKFGRLQNSPEADTLWQDYKKLYSNELQLLQSVMPLKYRLLSIIFRPAASRKNMRFKITLLRLLNF